MIRVNLLYEPVYAERMEPILNVSGLLRDLGVELVDQSDELADLLIVPSKSLPVLEAAGDPRVSSKLVVWERADQETVASHNRHLLKRPDVVGWLKDFLIRDVHLNNAPHVDGYWHYNLLPHARAAHVPRVPQPTLDEADFAKLGILHNVAGFSRFDQIRREEPPPLEERDIDICFIGTITYPEDPILQQHREDVCRALGGLGTYKVVMITNTKRVIPFELYFSLLRRSKIFVSPYGFSLSSWKDWEALYCGCVLMKPDSYQQVNYQPDLFANPSRYVEVAPDFSDVGSKLVEVLDDYERYQLASLEGRQALMECLDREQRALDIYRYVMKWLELPMNVNHGDHVSGALLERGAARVANGSEGVEPAAKSGISRLGEDELRSRLGRELVDYFDRFHIPERRRILGFHAEYYLLRLMFNLLRQGDGFVETGSLSGDTLALVARTFPFPCFSCEMDHDNFEAARRNISGQPNAQVFNIPSPEFLDFVYEREPALLRSRTVYWLDAHGPGREPPLPQEVSRITGSSDCFCIGIDDFQVPGEPRFGYDTLGSAVLTWDYIVGSIAPGKVYRVIYPRYTLRTSLHTEPRGWVIIAAGEWDLIPEGLESQYDVREYSTV